MKGVQSMLAAKLVSLSMALVMAANTVGGVDMDYEGEVDIYSGNPISSEDTSSRRTIALADGSLYDTESEMFIYTAPDTNLTVTSSVADGMMTTDPVSLDIDSGLSSVLYLDGEEEKDADLKNIKDPGKYSLVVTGSGTDHQLISFTIIPKKTGSVSSYKLPLGFDLKELHISGREEQFSNVGVVDLSQDGDYTITYHCNLTGKDYGLSVTIDHVPPAVTLEGVKDGSARGPVTIKDYAKEDSFDILLNGEDYSFPQDDKLTLPGKYELTITDDAGNEVTEKFEIKFYLNYQGLLFGLLFLAVIAAAIGYMIWSRKRLRVR